MKTLERHIEKSRTSDERTAHAIRTMHVARINGMFERGEIDVVMASKLLEGAGLSDHAADMMALTWSAAGLVRRAVEGFKP